MTICPTQNVDGLHARAGSSRVVELHGTLHRVVCADCGHDVSGVSDRDEVPRCPRCGGYARPAVVWFGEAIPEAAVQGEAEALMAAEAVLLVGSSLAVNTPARLLRSAERRGIPIVEVNPEPALPRAGDGSSTANRWDLPVATVVLIGAAGAVLPLLLRLDTIVSPSACFNTLRYAPYSSVWRQDSMGHRCPALAVRDDDRVVPS